MAIFQLGEAMKRRDFIWMIAGGAAAWPMLGHAQQLEMPLAGFVSSRSPDDNMTYAAAFRKGLSETGFVEGKNVSVEYHWISGQ